MTKSELLEKLRNQQRSTPGYDWHLGERIAILEIEIEKGIDICPTCKNAGEFGSPCGTCGRGMREI